MFIAPVLEESPISIEECPVRGGGTQIKQPIFARFLETPPMVITGVQRKSEADAYDLNLWTQKWPSDTDEW